MSTDIPTFFLESDAWHTPWQLDAVEAHHFSTVLRGKAGARIRLLDGTGREGIFRVLALAKRSVSLEPINFFTHPKPERETILAVAWTKAARRGWLMEKAVELGLSALWIWQGDHSQMQLPDKISMSWRQQLIAGAKQCNNPWLPELSLIPSGSAGLIAKAQSVERAFVLWEDESDTFLQPEDLALPGRTLFIIGPEGGLSGAEIDAFQAVNMRTVTVGRRILRYETAALLCLGLSWWGRERVNA